MHWGGKGREERRRGRGGLLSSDIVIKESPPPGLGPPTLLLSHCLAPRHTPVHTHCCLLSQRRNRPTREMKSGRHRETMREGERGGMTTVKFDLRGWHRRAWGKWNWERTGVKTVVSGRSAWRRPRLRSWLLPCFTVLWLYDTALYFFFVLNHWFPTEKHFTLLQPVDQDRHSRRATVCVLAVQMYYNIGTGVLPWS